MRPIPAVTANPITTVGPDQTRPAIDGGDAIALCKGLGLGCRIPRNARGRRGIEPAFADWIQGHTQRKVISA